MKIHKGEFIQHLRNPVISIGVFDGVHRGHAAVFDRVRLRAKELDGESVIVTFWPHPRMVLTKNSDQPEYLTGLEEKKALISQHGMDHLVIISFTKEFSCLPACDFVKRYLIEGAGLRHLVFGFDHHFGHRREGNYENLKSCAREFGFGIEQLEPVLEGGCRISSSAIRQALYEGNVRLANALLSYQYSMSGRIAGGRQFGRVIGFPTANIELEDDHKLIPADGVYAVEVIIDGETFMGMMNIGYRPTINMDNNDKTLEVHIMNFEADVYNHDIRIRFIERIRDERQFGTPEMLKQQLTRDRDVAVQLLSAKAPGKPDTKKGS